MAPKIDAKSMKNRGCGADAFLERPLAGKRTAQVLRGWAIWRPFWTKNWKKASKKACKNYAEKVLKINTKRLPKWYQNGCQNSKINEISYFSEKGWNARNYLFYNRKRGSRYFKSHEKSVQNLCKIDARKRHAKSIENYTKMHPKWEPKSMKNLKNTEKNGIRKLMPKFDAKKNQNMPKKIKTFRQPHFFIDFGSIFWPCQGVGGR